MVAVDNTKRRYAVAILANNGLKFEGTVPLTISQIDVLRLDLKQKRPLELTVSMTQVAVIPHATVAALIINELVLDKLQEKDSNIVVN